MNDTITFTRPELDFLVRSASRPDKDCFTTVAFCPNTATTVEDGRAEALPPALPSSSATAELTATEAFSAARQELERTDRVIDALQDGGAPSATFDFLREIHQKYAELEITTPEQGVMFASSLATDLSFALQALETNLDDFKTWRRVTRAANPDARVVRIPRRFVRRASASNRSDSDVWTETDHAVWDSDVWTETDHAVWS